MIKYFKILLILLFPMATWGMQQQFQAAKTRKIVDTVALAACQSLVNKSEFGSPQLLKRTTAERHDFFIANSKNLILSRVWQEEQTMLAHSSELASKAQLLKDLSTKQKLDRSSKQDLEAIETEQANVQTYINQLQAKIEQLKLENKQLADQFWQSTDKLSIDELLHQIDRLIYQKNGLIKEFNRKASLPGFTSMALAKLKVELDHAVELLDMQMGINEKAFRTKADDLSIEQLNSLKSQLQKKVNKIEQLIRLPSNHHNEVVENYKTIVECSKQRMTIVQHLIKMKNVELSQQACNASQPRQSLQQVEDRWSAIIPDFLRNSCLNLSSWFCSSIKTVDDLWKRAYEIKGFIEKELETGNVLAYVYGFIKANDVLPGESNSTDYNEQPRFNGAEKQQFYEGLRRLQVYLQQFYEALCQCDADSTDRLDNLIGEVQKRLQELKQTVNTIETLTPVDRISVDQMAERMENEKIGPHGPKSQTLDDLLRFLVRCCLGGVLNVSAGVKWGGGNPADFTIHAGPLSKTYTFGENAESDQQSSAATIRHQELLDAQAKNDAASETQSSTTADPAPAPAAQTTTTKTESIAKDSAQQQLNSFENELKQSGPLTAARQNLLSALHDPIITSDKFEVGNAQHGGISPELLDFANSATMLAIEKARAGNMGEAQALADMKNYLISCAQAGKDYYVKALIDTANIPAAFAGISNIQKDVRRQEIYLGLMLFNEACELTGLLKGTPEKDNLERVIANHIQEDIQLGEALAAELKTTTKNLFKEGKFIGICKITGYIGGALTSGAVMQKAGALLSRLSAMENNVLINVASKTAEATMTPEGIGVAVKTAEGLETAAEIAKQANLPWKVVHGLDEDIKTIIQAVAQDAIALEKGEAGKAIAALDQRLESMLNDVVTVRGKNISFKQYCENLMRDSDHKYKITQCSIEEAIAACSAERQGILKGPVLRGRHGDGADFIDALGTQWDSKRAISQIERVPIVPIFQTSTKNHKNL